jgi:aerobic carbon-monoxide dehydrogenase small subunit
MSARVVKKPRGRAKPVNAGGASAATSMRVTMNVNGRERRVSVPPMKRLLDVLREDLGLTGTKEGCGEGECGACSVLMNRRSVNSCLVPVAQAAGTSIVTVEGLARGRTLSALQQAFIEFGGAQCGICTPGMLVTASELLARTKGRVPSDEEVREALAGNLCRCTGYQKIVDAVRAAARGSKRNAREATPTSRGTTANTHAPKKKKRRT